MRSQCSLQVGRRDRDPSPSDDVLAAGHEGEIPIGAQRADIPRAEESVAREGGAIQLVVAVVTQESVRPTHQDIPLRSRR